MNLLVVVQMAPLTEGLPAQFAPVGFLSGMDPHVDLESGELMAVSAADPTHVLPGFFLRWFGVLLVFRSQRVFPEGAGEVVCLPAHGTGVRFLPRVKSHVVGHGALCDEPLPTDGAEVGFLRLEFSPHRDRKSTRLNSSHL